MNSSFFAILSLRFRSQLRKSNNRVHRKWKNVREQGIPTQGSCAILLVAPHNTLLPCEKGSSCEMHKCTRPMYESKCVWALHHIMICHLSCSDDNAHHTSILIFYLQVVIPSLTTITLVVNTRN